MTTTIDEWHTPTVRTLRQRIDYVREAVGAGSVRQLSIDCGLSPATLGNRINAAEKSGSVNMDARTLSALETHTGFRSHWILTGEEPARDRDDGVALTPRYPYRDEAKQALVDDGISERDAERAINAVVAFDEGDHGSSALHLYRAAKQLLATMKGKAVGVREMEE